VFNRTRDITVKNNSLTKGNQSGCENVDEDKKISDSEQTEIESKDKWSKRKKRKSISIKKKYRFYQKPTLLVSSASEREKTIIQETSYNIKSSLKNENDGSAYFPICIGNSPTKSCVETVLPGSIDLDNNSYSLYAMN